MHLQLIGKFARVAALAVSLAACMPPAEPQPAEPQYANNPVFARRASPAGRPTYLETIKYIDDGMRYAEPANATAENSAVAAKAQRFSCVVNDNGAGFVLGMAITAAGSPTLIIDKASVANWTLSTDQTSVDVSIKLEIQ